MTVLDLSTPEGKAALAAEIEKATAPLIAKRDELLGEVKKLRKGAEIDPADLEKVEAERDELRQQLAEATKAAKKVATDLEAERKAREAIDSAYTNSLRDAQLTEALAKVGVTNAVHLKAAKALLSQSLEVADENGSRVVKAGGKALGEYITEWAAGDEGKHFVAAPDTTGGGAQGAYRGTHSDAKRSAMNHLQKAEYIAKHGSEAYLKLPE